MAGPILSHVSAAQHGVTVMTCAAKRRKTQIQKDASAQKHLWINSLGMDALANAG